MKNGPKRGLARFFYPCWIITKYSLKVGNNPQ